MYNTYFARSAEMYAKDSSRPMPFGRPFVFSPCEKLRLSQLSLRKHSMLLQPVILSGGSGTRLWPLSREKHPKQLLSLFNNETMLQATASRVRSFTAK